MTWQALLGLAAVGGLLAQEPQEAQQPQGRHPSAAERVAAVLRANDPSLDGKGAADLLGPGVELDAAIRATATSPHTERLVRLRALRLARLLRLAQRLHDAPGGRDVAWWLAFDEITREAPALLRPFLLARSGMDDAALAAAARELAAARAVAGTFCTEWNEMRWLDEAHAAQDAKYDALEKSLREAGAAAVPALFGLLVVPPEMTFTVMMPGKATSGREQVRALLGLCLVLHANEALPFYVMHTATPSLTMSADASLAVQAASGRDFGAAPLNPGDDAATMAWWREHLGEHPVVLGWLVQHLVRLAEREYPSHGAEGSDGLWCAVLRVNRVLGEPERPPGDATVETLRARLLEAETITLEREIR